MSTTTAKAMAGTGLILLLASCAMEGGGKLDWREDPANFSVDRVPLEMVAQHNTTINGAHRTWPGRLVVSDIRR